MPPPDYTSVGWWAAGVRPGAPHGTAILTGHTVDTGGGVFDELGKLRAGQRVIVGRLKRDLAYQVTSVLVYPRGTLARKAPGLFSQDGPGRLALVTCADWDGTRYLSNVVVLARQQAAGSAVPARRPRRPPARSRAGP